MVIWSERSGFDEKNYGIAKKYTNWQCLNISIFFTRSSYYFTRVNFNYHKTNVNRTEHEISTAHKN